MVKDASGVPVPRDDAAARALEQREGWLMWPERFGPKEIGRIKTELGPYMASGRLQQSPMPAKGGIFDRTWWQVYEPARFDNTPNKFPHFEFVIASVDSAFTGKEQNDPTGFTMWGVFSLPGQLSRMAGVEVAAGTLPGEVRASERERIMATPEDWTQVWQGSSWPRETRAIMLIRAWRKHLPFSGPRMERQPHETWWAYKQRTQSSWGLMEWLYDSIYDHTRGRFLVDRILIEAKASGISAAQELRNRFSIHNQAIQLCPVKGDKVARALAVQPMFSGGMIYAPAMDWADLVITEMSMFPVGRYDDLTDSATQALLYLRNIGLAWTAEEEHHVEIGTVMHKPRRLKSLYPC